MVLISRKQEISYFLSQKVVNGMSCNDFLHDQPQSVPNLLYFKFEEDLNRRNEKVNAIVLMKN